MRGVNIADSSSEETEIPISVTKPAAKYGRYSDGAVNSEISAEWAILRIYVKKSIRIIAPKSIIKRK